MDAALRILDANLNRAREGLRTAEEYARLALGDAALSAQVRDIRQQLQHFAQADKALAARMLQARDIENDVGTHPEGSPRQGLEDIARAGMKRAQEALRVAEETAQALNAPAAPVLASARYAAYAAEQQLFVAGPRRKLLADSPVMVVFTRSQCRGPWRDALDALLGAGARLFQLREKDAPAAEFARHGQEFRALARNCVVIVNDRADIAAAHELDGVHLGQQDLPPAVARAVVGPSRLVGISTHDAREAAAAIAAGADYIGLGAMFPTGSKKVQSFAAPEVVREVVGSSARPVFCIGGIGPDNAGKLAEFGVRHAAAGASILGATEPATAFKEVHRAIAGQA